jgi:lysophospholipase L1-like esterase
MERRISIFVFLMFVFNISWAQDTITIESVDSNFVTVDTSVVIDEDKTLELPYPDILGYVDTSLINEYPFINFRENRIKFFSDSTPNFERFFDLYDGLRSYKDRQLFAYHIGGSHIQADVYSHDVREHLGIVDSLQAPRGLLFPFDLLGFDYPYNYRVKHTGEWSGVRNTIRRDSSDLGLLGLKAYTSDSLASITMYKGARYEKDLAHNKVRIYRELDSSFVLSFPDRSVLSEFTNIELGYQEFEFVEIRDTFEMSITKMDTSANEFVLYGVELMSERPGIVYTSIGINGASFRSYARCQLFEQQLSARPPDLFIISIGTNDANTPDFDSVLYETNYRNMLDLILRTNPDCAILLTVPNDCWYKRKYPNKNTKAVQNVIYKLAKEYGMGVWSVYEMMGGFNSSLTWYENKLMRRDRIHFTRDGYHLKGSMLIEALEKFFIEMKLNNLEKIGKQ